MLMVLYDVVGALDSGDAVDGEAGLLIKTDTQVEQS
jgi:hypothetical protein